MSKVLPRKFFNRETTVVAKELLGKNLVRKIGSKTIRLPITEVEVYDGFTDRASHAARGQTPRNAPMWGHAGHWYVYFTYGIHWMLNIVTREHGYPGAVLIRGAGDADYYLGGPARLTKALGIDRTLNTLPAIKKSGLWIEDAPLVPLSKIKRTPRIGIASSGPVWSKRLLRFVLK